MKLDIKRLLAYLNKVVAPLTLIALIVLAIKEVPGVLDFLKWTFANIGTNGQVLLVVIVGISMIYFIILFTKRDEELKLIKAERDALADRLEATEKELQLIEEANIRRAEEDVKQYIWKRDISNAPIFVSKNERTAKFISVLNFKGGVGKTTLTANLGACLALMDAPLKVLLVDLDFQSTLSNMSVEATRLIGESNHENISSKLLDPNLTIDEFWKLTIPVNGVKNADIIIADITIERKDKEEEAKFFLDSKRDIRFFFRRTLHQREITNKYDVVLFDCPPRLTASTVNALTSSDYVLIPTRLDDRSIEAVPRTLDFLSRLTNLNHPSILGIIANEVRFWRRLGSSRLVAGHQDGRARLKTLLSDIDPDLYIFDNMVQLITEDKFANSKNKIPGVDETIRTNYFLSVAKELRKRIDK